MSDCCPIKGTDESCARVLSDANAATRCLDCATEGRPVERQTILHHVKHEHFARVNGEPYRFCPDPNCAVVYFGKSETRLTVNEVRELVSAKTSGDARTICYCFGFTEGDAREEIAHDGTTDIPNQIGQLIKTGMCACEVRNPSSQCCLPEVNRTIKRLLLDYKSD